MSNWEVLNFYLENTILGETRTIQITLNLQRPVSLKPKGEFFPHVEKLYFTAGLTMPWLWMGALPRFWILHHFISANVNTHHPACYRIFSTVWDWPSLGGSLQWLMVSEGSAAGRGFAGMEEVRQLHVRFCKGIKIWHRAWFLCSLLGREPQEREAGCQLGLCTLSACLEGWLVLPSLQYPILPY